MEIPLTQATGPVSVFLSKQPSNFIVTSISKIQIQGKAEVYEIKAGNGKIIYINNDGIQTEL